MKKNILLIFIIFLMLFSISCKSNQNKTEKPKTASLLHQTAPQNGEIILKIEKVLSFDPSKDNIDAIGVGMVRKDKGGNYYFYNSSKVKILKYNNKGKFIKSFLRKGKGPGELPYIMDFAVVENGIYVSDGEKTIKFDFDGNMVFEKKLKIRCFPVAVRDDKTVIGTFYDKESMKNKKVKKKLALLNTEGKIIKGIVSTDKSGQIIIRTGKMIMAFMMPGATPSLVWAYNKKDDTIYYAESDKYLINSINLKTGKTVSFGKVYKDIFLTTADKKKMADNFSNTSEDLKKAFAKQLPDRRMPIVRFRALPSGYLAVITPYKGLDNTVDIFDNKGDYIYRIINKKDNLDFSDFDYFSDGHLGYLKETDNGIIFTEYKVIEPKDVF